MQMPEDFFGVFVRRNSCRVFFNLGPALRSASNAGVPPAPCTRYRLLSKETSRWAEAPFVDMVCKPWVTELEEQVRDWIAPRPQSRSELS